MVARGYTTKELVAAELGVTLTSAQNTQCDGLIAEAEDWIDQESGRVWISASPITAEVVTVPTDGVVYLRNRPVTAISAVTVRPPLINSTVTTLVDDSTFELMQAAEGILVISSAYAGYLATISYTHTNNAGALPGSIQRAATLLVAHWMEPRLHPERSGLDSLSINAGELSLKMAKRDIPAEVLRLVHQRDGIVFA